MYTEMETLNLHVFKMNWNKYKTMIKGEFFWFSEPCSGLILEECAVTILRVTESVSSGCCSI